MIEEINSRSKELVKIWIFGLIVTAVSLVILLSLTIGITLSLSASTSASGMEMMGGGYIAVFTILAITIFAVNVFCLVKEIVTYMRLRDEHHLLMVNWSRENMDYERTIEGLKTKLLVILLCYLLFFTGISFIVSLVFKFLFWDQSKCLERMFLSKGDGRDFEPMGRM